MPFAFAGERIESEHAVCEKIHSFACAAVDEIARRGTGRAKYPAALFIERKSAPGIGAAVGLAFFELPGVVTDFALVRHGVEDPFELAGLSVIGANVAWRGVVFFRHARTDDEHVPIYNAG
jgi:hypothetical protein